jgi:chromatin structure-remodeling complex subunit RSC1/2
MPAASSNGSTDEALTPVMSQNTGWYGANEWGEDPQKTAEALAEFSSQYGSDAGQLNFSQYLS